MKRLAHSTLLAGFSVIVLAACNKTCNCNDGATAAATSDTTEGTTGASGAEQTRQHHSGSGNANDDAANTHQLDGSGGGVGNAAEETGGNQRVVGGITPENNTKTRPGSGTATGSTKTNGGAIVKSGNQGTGNGGGK